VSKKLVTALCRFPVVDGFAPAESSLSPHTEYPYPSTKAITRTLEHPCDWRHAENDLRAVRLMKGAIRTDWTLRAEAVPAGVNFIDYEISVVQ
jgi:hypothetical protein